MDYRRSFRQFSLTPLSRRLRYIMSRLFGSRLQKSQKVTVVVINGQRFKRVILRDSYLAATIEHSLEQFGPSMHVPGFVIRYEHEVWVDFVDGEVPGEISEDLVRKLAAYYAHIYSRAPREIPAAGSVWLTRVDRDLRFLEQVGVLSAAAHSGIVRGIDAMTPTNFWVGFDYNDPVVKNFVLTTDGVVCGIDVESLVEDQLLGLGVAKALMRWMEPYRAVFLEAFASSDAPDFVPYLEFIELSHLAAYTKLMFVERKWANVDPARFDRFC
jgi:hypothetical protein